MIFQILQHEKRYLTIICVILLKRYCTELNEIVKENYQEVELKIIAKQSSKAA
jgi:hypothetical protein